MPIISIIIPVYNVQDYINITLNSLLAQEDKDFEIIIVNDGSTDNTLNVVEEIMGKSEIKDYKIIDKPNGGVSAARNAGILESTGEYIYFLDGDDYISNDMISTVKSHIKDKGSDVIAWGYNVVRDDKSIISNYFDLYSSELSTMTGIEALQNILIKSGVLWIWTCSAIYRKNLIIENNLFYTQGCSNGEDQEFTFKVLSRSKKVGFINKVLSFYVQREGSISNSYNIKRFDAINAFDRTAKYIKNNITDENKQIVEYLEYNHLLENYFYNLNSCIEYLRLEKRMHNTQAINYLMNDINRVYPGLNDYIKNKIKSTKSNRLKSKIKYKLFLINPFLYGNVVYLHNKLKYKKVI